MYHINSHSVDTLVSVSSVIAAITTVTFGRVMVSRVAGQRLENNDNIKTKAILNEAGAQEVKVVLEVQSRWCMNG